MRRSAWRSRRPGWLYPFFGTLLGWLGVALTGSDTSSNVLFGSLQRITAEQLGLSPTLMAAANSSGGVMGKMIDAQSIVVASTATRWYGHEGEILRYVFFHSVALACLVALLVMLQAYVPPFSRWSCGRCRQTQPGNSLRTATGPYRARFTPYSSNHVHEFGGGRGSAALTLSPFPHLCRPPDRITNRDTRAW